MDRFKFDLMALDALCLIAPFLMLAALIFTSRCPAEEPGVYIQGQPVGCRCVDCQCGPDCRCTSGVCACPNCKTPALTIKDVPSASTEPVVWRTKAGPIKPLQIFQVSTDSCYWCDVQRPDFIKVGKEAEAVADFSFIKDDGARALFPELKINAYPTTVVYLDDKCVAMHVGRQTDKQLRAIVQRWKK